MSKTRGDKWLEKILCELSWFVHLTKNVEGGKSKMRRWVGHVAHFGEEEECI